MEHYLREAIKSRESRRAYLRLPLRKQDSDRIRSLIWRYNAESKLKMRLIEIDEELFKKYRNGLSLLKNVVNYIALIGDAGDQGMEDKIGYYGELLVLEATAIDLATCWITRSYNKALCEERLELKEGDKLVGIIAIGYPVPKKAFRESIIQSVYRLLGKRGGNLIKQVGKDAPDWVLNGMNAVLRAPSRPPMHPYSFSMTNEGRIKALPDNQGKRIELGIAMVHFEIGAAIGRWYKEEGVWTFAVSHVD